MTASTDRARMPSRAGSYVSRRGPSPGGSGPRRGRLATAPVLAASLTSALVSSSSWSTPPGPRPSLVCRRTVGAYALLSTQGGGRLSSVVSLLAQENAHRVTEAIHERGSADQQLTFGDLAVLELLLEWCQLRSDLHTTIRWRALVRDESLSGVAQQRVECVIVREGDHCSYRPVAVHAPSSQALLRVLRVEHAHRDTDAFEPQHGGHLVADAAKRRRVHDHDAVALGQRLHQRTEQLAERR